MIKTKPRAANTKLSTPRLFFAVISKQIEMYFNVSKLLVMDRKGFEPLTTAV